jgi:hypothetical protein
MRWVGSFDQPVRMPSALYRSVVSPRPSCEPGPVTVEFYAELGGGGPLWVGGRAWDPRTMLGLSSRLARDLGSFAVRWGDFVDGDYVTRGHRGLSRQVPRR